MHMYFGGGGGSGFLVVINTRQWSLYADQTTHILISTNQI